ncbi:hypothetical protein H6P81_012811 [Aristolochia fimbriata]|uniref:Uncharacterized protein n=1 Tax=Aristolochia fimbriata TaxID=158543 RepID=A0AAV7ED70_ARIFI|nr:hypothetical protein H6P81_012811 [Aristolochia fimbriata]
MRFKDIREKRQKRKNGDDSSPECNLDSWGSNDGEKNWRPTPKIRNCAGFLEWQEMRGLWNVEPSPVKMARYWKVLNTGSCIRRPSKMCFFVASRTRLGCRWMRWLVDLARKGFLFRPASSMLSIEGLDNYMKKLISNGRQVHCRRCLWCGGGIILLHGSRVSRRRPMGASLPVWEHEREDVIRVGRGYAKRHSGTGCMSTSPSGPKEERREQNEFGVGARRGCNLKTDFHLSLLDHLG